MADKAMVASHKTAMPQVKNQKTRPANPRTSMGGR